jgi:Fe-S cluster assembly protein SufD
MSRPVGTYLEQIPGLLLERHEEEPEWVGELRRRAMDACERVGLPTARDEEWKLSPAGKSLARVLDLRPPAAPEADLDVPEIEGAAATLVFVDGVYVPSRSRRPDPESGLRVGSLREALRSAGGGVPAWLGRCADFTGRGLAALNTAVPADGALVVIDGGVEAAGFVHLVYLTTPAAAGRLTPVRNLIVAGSRSRGRILEHHAGPGADSVSSPVTEVAVEQGAGVEFTKLLTGNHDTVHLASVDAIVAADARFDARIVSTGAANGRTETRVRLDGRGAECDVAIAALARGSQVQDQLTRIEHAVPDAASRQLHRAVVTDRARSIFNGLVVVRPGAHGTTGEQSSRNILLSADADAHARPQLDISEDDVRCAHGATVGALDPEALYYMRTRGIDAADAQRLLVRAFAMEVVDRISEGPMRTAAARCVNDWLAS